MRQEIRQWRGQVVPSSPGLSASRRILSPSIPPGEEALSIQVLLFQELLRHASPNARDANATEPCRPSFPKRGVLCDSASRIDVPYGRAYSSSKFSRESGL